MYVTELNKDQICLLKQDMLMRLLDKVGQTPSYGELMDVDSFISDDDVRNEFAGVDFVQDDFWN